jgi:hypothetical protein
VPKTIGKVLPVVGFPVGFVGDRVADVGHLVGHQLIGGVGRSIYDHGKPIKKQLDQNQIDFLAKNSKVLDDLLVSKTRVNRFA